MHKLIDRMFTEEELEALPEPAYSTIDRLAYYCDEEDAYIFSTDGAQYMNHSDEPNIRDDVALRDIAKGVDLFEDYHYEYDE